MATDLDAHPRRALDAARRSYHEDSGGALATALRCHEAARSLGDASLQCRALALQGAVMVHRGDLRGAFALAAEAERHARRGAGDAARAELAALKSHLSCFSGAYAESLRLGERAIELADRDGDPELRVIARRAANLVLGYTGAERWRDRFTEHVRLAVESGNRWEEAVARNDWACHLQACGELEEAEEAVERGLAIARGLGLPNHFAVGLLTSTRGDIRLQAGRAEEALADAERSIALLRGAGEPNPYVFGMTLRLEVQALLALGRLDDVQRTAERALGELSDRVPGARSLIMETAASALRAAGRTGEAYTALDESVALEREAFKELSELQLGLERATLETAAARREADALAANNRELEAVFAQLADAHAELERRTRQLEALQDQLREQADRDWLTGLHNRRFLARELERLGAEPATEALSLAVLDLDHFKSINDRFGHEAGDRVLVRVAGLLLQALRMDDVVVRTGGEEFVVLMPHTDEAAAAACCERLLAAIRGDAWERIADGMAVTASVGIATARDGIEPAALAQFADRRLYDAKRAGRDRAVA